MNATVKNLSVGTMIAIPCGDVNVHVYSTGDPIDDRVIILERGKRGVVIELPCFKDSIEAVSGWIASEGVSIEAKMVSYHAAGASFLPDVPCIMTESAERHNTVGGGMGLIRSFAETFGASFDDSTPSADRIVPAGRLSVAGIDMDIVPDQDAYKVEIPGANAVYMHMLGHDCHSIIAGPAHADAAIAELRSYLDRGFDLFLSSHYGPESREDVETKIAYLEDLKAIASSSSSAAEFKEAVAERFPGYSGANYLDMTAGLFFKD